jgi:predicted RNA-binding Zn-ribbon protein involved in translation (DUF1610 family)
MTRHGHWTGEKIMEPKGNVLYVYRCAECGHRGAQRLADDSHDGEASTCSVCGATVALEWDGGVKFDAPKRHAGH